MAYWHKFVVFVVLFIYKYFKISTNAENPICNNSWKDSSKSWLDSNKFWLNEDKTVIEDLTKSTAKDANTRTSGIEKETYENKKEEKGEKNFLSIDD